MIRIVCYKSNNLSPINFIAYISKKAYVSNNKCLELYLQKNKCYKIQVLNKQQIVFYNGQDITVTFVFNVQNYQRVIFLKDKNYKGLLIKKGEVILNGI